ncbi:hypothetical protein SUGI_1197390 [Cryptomeria japonica]|uniref:uncharacterized protein LOC131035816 n=1 Tax=Cryptomeria japonica TaxID=3369 RepID=UPI0024148D65|nr:uncharacterized protein LOC131035816 [Cryptomeria japonica]GLJ55758.1 hypothetical protein SUGI_1197390 [Cryptomeria japonica]
MDGGSKAEKLQGLSTFGIVGESLRILRCYPKLIGAITVTLVLPLSLATLLHTLIAVPLSLQILSDQLNLITGDDVYDLRALHDSRRQLSVFVALETTYAVFVYALSFLLTAAMAFTVACFYSTKQEPSFAKLTRALPGMCKRIVVTSAWPLLGHVGNVVGFSVTVCLLIWGFNYFNVSSAGPFNAALIVTCVVYVRIWLSIVVVWRLACVVSVLEEKYYGLEGVKKSYGLITGKDTTALALTFFFLMIKSGLSYLAVNGNWDSLCMEESSAYGTVLLMLECVVTMLGPLTQSVLYFVCKAYHDESFDQWWIVDQLKGSLGDYLPIKNTDLSLNN